MACNRVLLGWIAFAILCIATGLCTEVTAIDGEVERPFHVLFLAGGSRGDVQPAVSVAAVMKKRGMKVRGDQCKRVMLQRVTRYSALSLRAQSSKTLSATLGVASSRPMRTTRN